MVQSGGVHGAGALHVLQGSAVSAFPRPARLSQQLDRADAGAKQHGWFKTYSAAPPPGVAPPPLKSGWSMFGKKKKAALKIAAEAADLPGGSVWRAGEPVFDVKLSFRRVRCASPQYRVIWQGGLVVRIR